MSFHSDRRAAPSHPHSCTPYIGGAKEGDRDTAADA